VKLDARSGTSHAAGAGERGGANLGSMTGDGSVITRKHKMTVDEACQILNVKNVPFSQGPSQPVVSEELSKMLKAYERMYQANENTSKYILSKVVRAKDRISAEVELAQNSKTPP
jgi:import inner membrane translocase subunit TIM16